MAFGYGRYERNSQYGNELYGDVLGKDLYGGLHGRVNEKKVQRNRVYGRLQGRGIVPSKLGKVNGA